MTFKKLSAVLAAGAFAVTLTACGDSADDNAQTTAPQVAASPTGSHAPPAPIDVELGETITLVQDVDGPRKVELTINEISVSDQCHHGMNNYSETAEDGGYYIQLVGEMSAIEGERGYSLSETWMTGTTADGYAVTFSPAFSCVDPAEVMDGYQNFDSNIIAGQKARGVLEFWASEKPETITLNEPYEPDMYTWKVPTDGASASEPAAVESHAPAFSPPAAAPTTPAAPPAPAAEPVIGFTGAPGVDTPRVLDKTIESCGDPMMHETGTTFFTDGTSGWTQQCADQMGY